MLDQAFRTIGAGGLAIILLATLISAVVRVPLERPRFSGVGIIVGLVTSLLLFTLTPVHTDTPVPPPTLWVIPGLGMVLLFTFLPLSKAILHAGVIGVIGFAANMAWIGNVFDGYIKEPARFARLAKGEVQRAERRAREDVVQFASDERSHFKSLPEGYVDDLPYDIPTRKLTKVVYVAEWHSPITGLYLDRSKTLRLWTPGGAVNEAITGVRAVESSRL